MSTTRRRRHSAESRVELDDVPRPESPASQVGDASLREGGHDTGEPRSISRVLEVRRRSEDQDRLAVEADLAKTRAHAGSGRSAQRAPGNTKSGNAAGKKPGAGATKPGREPKEANGGKNPPPLRKPGVAKPKRADVTRASPKALSPPVVLPGVEEEPKPPGTLRAHASMTRGGLGGAAVNVVYAHRLGRRWKDILRGTRGVGAGAFAAFNPRLVDGQERDRLAQEHRIRHLRSTRGGIAGAAVQRHHVGVPTVDVRLVRPNAITHRVPGEERRYRAADNNTGRRNRGPGAGFKAASKQATLREISSVHKRKSPAQRQNRLPLFEDQPAHVLDKSKMTARPTGARALLPKKKASGHQAWGQPRKPPEDAPLPKITTKLPRVASIKVKAKEAVRRAYEWADQGQGILHLRGERPPSAGGRMQTDAYGRPPYQWPILGRRLKDHVLPTGDNALYRTPVMQELFESFREALVEGADEGRAGRILEERVRRDVFPGFVPAGALAWRVNDFPWNVAPGISHFLVYGTGPAPAEIDEGFVSTITSFVEKQIDPNEEFAWCLPGVQTPTTLQAHVFVRAIPGYVAMDGAKRKRKMSGKVHMRASTASAFE